MEYNIHAILNGTRNAVIVCSDLFWGTRTIEMSRSKIATRTWIHGSQKQERSEEHTSELQSRGQLVCRLLLEKKKQEKTYSDARKKQNADGTWLTSLKRRSI